LARTWLRRTRMHSSHFWPLSSVKGTTCTRDNEPP
jgi:hypothetical protein